MKILFLVVISTFGHFTNTEEENDLFMRNKDLLSRRIINGHEAKKDGHPWQVFIYNTFSRSTCGGTIISPDYVLSAAHCVGDRRLHRYTVYIGYHNIRKPETYSIKLSVSAIIVHHLFNGETLDYDIALVKLERSLDLTGEHYRAMNLPAQDDVFDGSNCIVTGWGRTIDKNKTSNSDVLMEVPVPVLSGKDCSASALGSLYRDRIMICAGYLVKGGKDFCQGDSGGPLICKLENGSRMLAGIVSGNIGCGHKNTPSVYTRVSEFVNWIRLNMT